MYTQNKSCSSLDCLGELNGLTLEYFLKENAHRHLREWYPDNVVNQDKVQTWGFNQRLRVQNYRQLRDLSPTTILWALEMHPGSSIDGWQSHIGMERFVLIGASGAICILPFLHDFIIDHAATNDEKPYFIPGPSLVSFSTQDKVDILIFPNCTSQSLSIMPIVHNLGVTPFSDSQAYFILLLEEVL